MFEGMHYVYEVYREKSFSKAAQKLFISQPSLSASVKRIEQSIGYPIFDRSSKPVGLTECGKQYIQAIERIMAIQNEFTDFVNDYGELKIGNLTFGGSNLFSSWLLPPLMAEYAGMYPGIRLSLVEDSTYALTELLQKGEIDFVLDNSELDGRLFERYPFMEEKLMLAVPASFAVNEQLKEYQIPLDRIRDREFYEKEIRDIPLRFFAKEPFIMLKQENDTGRRAAEICREQKFTPRVAFKLDQQMTAYNITCSGQGISFIGDALILHFPAVTDAVYYKLGGKHSTRKLYFYWKKGRYLNRAMEELLKCVEERKFSFLSKEQEREKKT